MPEEDKIENNNNGVEEEELEYESDEERFENSYIQSQLATNSWKNDKLDENSYDNDTDIENTFGNDTEQEKHYEKQFEEEFKKEYSDNAEVGEDIIEELSVPDNIENEDIENSETHIGERHEDIPTPDNDSIEIFNTNLQHYETLDDMDDFSESEDDVDKPDIIVNQTDKTREDSIVEIGSNNKLDDNADPFDDDELIEYVNGPEDLINEATSIDNANKRKNEESDSIVMNPKSLCNIPIYLDFCELISEKETVLENAFLKDEIKVNFDFMKLFQPECKEDELYCEFKSLFNSLDDCIDLEFSRIFEKLSDMMDIDLRRINIHLTFGDLLNFTIESDSISGNTLSLRELLKEYKSLKDQSSNPDLYGFLSIRVWLTRTIRRQFTILKKSSVNGYRLENINKVIDNKIICSEAIEEDDYGSSIKRRKF
jgi:hypothetical protein